MGYLARRQGSKAWEREQKEPLIVTQGPSGRASPCASRQCPLQAEHRAPHAREQFHILDGCLGDPAFVDRQSCHFASGVERPTTICTSSPVAGSYVSLTPFSHHL